MDAVDERREGNSRFHMPFEDVHFEGLDVADEAIDRATDDNPQPFVGSRVKRILEYEISVQRIRMFDAFGNMKAKEMIISWGRIWRVVEQLIQNIVYT